MTQNVLSAAERREKMLATLKKSDSPQSAGALGKMFGVSRQVIVQDIALLRAEGESLLSTHRGYLSAKPSVCRERTFKVYHSEDRLAEELNLIVDLGGTVKNVSVSHRIYGRIEAALNISDRVGVAELVRSIGSGKSRPLMTVTDGYHYHAVTAADEETLDEIARALKENGFLVEE